MQASTKTGKKKDPEKKGIMKFAWNDQQKMDHGIDPIIWNSWNEKWDAAGMNSWTDFYKVPVEHGGPTSLEISAYTRAKQQWLQVTGQHGLDAMFMVMVRVRVMVSMD